MTNHISPDLMQFVDQEIANGNFPNRDAVIEYALRVLKRDRDEAIQGIKAGLTDVAAGRVQSLNEAFDDLRQDLRSTRGT